MELTQLRYFAAVAELQHVTKAAEQMNVAQPAITRSIRKLESELQVPLVKASGRNIVLTEYGQLLYDEIRKPLAALESVGQKLHRYYAQNEKTIRLNVTAASRAIASYIIQYKKENPQIDFSIIQNERSNSSDLVIASIQENETLPFKRFKVYSEKIFLAVPKNSPLAAREKIDLAALKDEGFICMAESFKIRAVCDQFCRRSGFAMRIVFESDNPETVRNLIEAGIGIGFWPEHTWGDIGEGIKLIVLEGQICRRNLLAALLEENKAEAVRFYNGLISQLDQLFSHDQR